MFFRLMPETGQFTEDEIVALRDWIEEYVLTPMERVPGVSSVDLRGGAPRQMQVFVDPVRLAEREIMLSQVRAAIRARNQDVSGGDLDSGKRRYLLRTIGRSDGPEELERLVIAERDGAYVRLEDVGHAELGYAEVRSFAYSEGRPILSFAVNRQIGSNVIAIKEAMLATVDDPNQRLLNPRGLKLVRTADDVVYVTDAIAVVERNLAIGAVLAAVRWISVGWVRPVGVIALVLAIAGAIIAWLTPAAEYLPEGEEAKVFTLMFAPPGYNIDMMREAFQRVDADFYPAVGQDRDAFAAGEIAVPPLNFTIGFASERLVFVVREATHRRDTEALMEVAREKTQQLPGLRSFSSRGSIFSSNFGATRSINIEISGPDLPTLFEAARQVKAKACGLFDGPRLKSEPSSLVPGQPMLEIWPDWERAAELGLTPGDLGYAIWAFSDGAFVDEVFVGDDEIDLFLYSTEGTIERPQDLERLLLSTPAGGVVPLSAVARLAETVNTETIRCVDAERTVTLSIIPPRAVPLEEGVRLVREQIIAGMPGNGELPPGIALTLSGASDRLEATRDALAGFFAVALLIAYLLMVAVFSHWGWPLLIMTSVPIGVSGGIAGLALLNLIGGQLDSIGLYPIQQPFDMITMLGFLVLIGTVVNNPILITERAVSNVRDAGMRVIDAISDAVRVRLRPIMMSMVTTVAGLSPLVLNPGPAPSSIAASARSCCSGCCSAPW